jgi:hypothetical protein
LRVDVHEYFFDDGAIRRVGANDFRNTGKNDFEPIRQFEISGRAEKVLKGSPKTVKRRLSQISDEELQKAVNRLQLESKYKTLTKPPDKHKRAKEIATKWLEAAGTKALESAATNLGKRIFSEADSKRKVEKRADIELEKDRQSRRVERVKAERDARAKEKAAKEKQAAEWKKAEETIRRSSNWKEFEKKRNSK